MSDTAQFLLPLVAAAQAQKHVTVNEALSRLDAMAQLRIQSRQVATPPVAPTEGEVWSVASGAVNDWAGQDGKLAISLNGAWAFVPPQVGWRAFVVDEFLDAVYEGGDWQVSTVAMDGLGAQTVFEVVSFDHSITAGTTNSTAGIIPNGAQVIGVTGRILSTISGTLTGWDLGVLGGTNRYGGSLGLAQGSWIRGLSGTPVTYWSDTPLLLSAHGGDFAAGSIRFGIHIVRLVPARSV